MSFTKYFFKFSLVLRGVFYFRNCSESDDEPDFNDDCYPSLDSVPSDNSITYIPRLNAQNQNIRITDSLLDEVSNTLLDRQDRLDKLEEMLTSAILTNNEDVSLLFFKTRKYD